MRDERAIAESSVHSIVIPVGAREATISANNLQSQKPAPVWILGSIKIIQPAAFSAKYSASQRTTAAFP